jgi:uncharacterized membrane protein
MDELLFHPRIVHLPIALAALMPLVAGGVAFAYMRGWADRRAWGLVLLLQGVMVASGLVAINTGEIEEERVEHVVAELYIDQHEEAAEIFIWASAIVLGLMAVPLALPKGELSNALIIFSSVATAAVLALGFWVGEAGGRLVYEHGAASVHVKAAEAARQGTLEAVEAYEEEYNSDE